MRSGILQKELLNYTKKANALLNKDQQAAIETYIDALYDLESLFAKKAFFKGCEFAVSFILDARNGGK